MEECNVLIVGGGLSGSSAAKHLNRLGVKGVVVIERLSETPYRRYHTICGEAVSDRMMRRAGLESHNPVCRVESIEIVTPSGNTTSMNVKGSIIDRNRLLAELREDSDADFIKDTALSVERDCNHFVVHTRNGGYRCKYLIGADGAHSIVRRDVFHYKPREYIHMVNHIVEGGADSVLRFHVSARFNGGYRWEFPSTDGFMSVGHVKDRWDICDYVSRGGRDIPVGGLPSVVSGNCVLSGDAASLCNPLSLGGIGAALLSGKKAAEAIASNSFRPYSRWISRDRMFDSRFMDARNMFRKWDDDAIEEALRPLSGKASLTKGLSAILRKPEWINVYMACWFGFGKGW